MYSSEKNPGINWKDLIIKAVFLVIFLLLLVWLFPKVPNMKPFYSNVFRENIKYMQDAAESYYTNERLPKNIGDAAEMTLQEMINKNLILPFVDQDGKECDTYSSYVQVKKNENDYTLKVNLVCETEKNYVEKTLGCYDYCDTCTQELEYQFKKETTTNKTLYSCPNGGTLSNGTCNIYSTDSYKATATTDKGEYYCPKGGTLSGTTCYVSSTDSYNASVSTGKYYCPYGGTLSGTKCYVDDSSSYAASTEYYCSGDGVLSGNLCFYETLTSGRTYPASIRNYRCPDGSISYNGSCKVTTSTSGSSYPASIVDYECSKGTKSGTNCIITSTAASTTIDATKSTKKKTYSGTYLASEKPKGATCSTSKANVCTSASRCPGYVTVYTSCYKYETSYTCPEGKGYKLNGTKCTKPGKTTTQTVAATPVYDCTKGGKLSGKTCYVSGTSYTQTVSGTPIYYCPNGSLTGNGDTCKVANSYTSQSYRASAKRTCPNGGYLNSNNRCVIDNSYVYNASKNDDQKYCPNGGILSNNKCIIDNSYTYQASLSTGKTVYTCPNGGELKDKSCYVTKLTKSYKATASTKKVNSVSYKWSKEQTLEGWTKTGETRIAASSMASKN